MQVLKRDGSKRPAQFDKISSRIQRLCYNLSHKVDPFLVAQKVIAGMYDGVSTTELDTLSAQTAAYMNADHPDYSKLAARIAVSRLHKNTEKSFVKVMEKLYAYVDPSTGEPTPLIAEATIKLVRKYKDEIEGQLLYSRDMNFDFFGFSTLQQGYLIKIGDETVERPQHMFMRVALGIWGEDIANVIKTYNELSTGVYMHASPTLFNAGTPKPQLSSCFLVCMEDDSIEGIYRTLAQCAAISKGAGGIGVSISNIRARGSYIRGTNGHSNGVVPMMKVFNATARYVDQGGGKRKGAISMYLEPWHADIFDFLEARRNTGLDEQRTRDLFLGLWVPDLFMKRVEEDGKWSLFCPDACKGLNECWGADFVRLYEKYESEGRARKVIRAQDLWTAILDLQPEAGLPYILYKDACNAKSNQQNLGTIKCSNLCVAGETLLLTDNGHIEIAKMAGQTVNVWTGFEFSPAWVLKTGENQEMIKVTFSTGASIICTRYHKFIIESTNGPLTECTAQAFEASVKQGFINRVDAQDLTLGLCVAKHCMPDGGVYARSAVRVTGLELLPTKMDTYCFQEPTRHMGILNGVLTGNCTEIIEYTSKDEVAVCNLASLALPKFVSPDGKTFDFYRLAAMTQRLVENLNRIIDINYYPIEQARNSNMRNRPIGIGVQGLADTFIKMRMPFDSDRAAVLNKEIFETIYYAALTKSCEMAERDGPYESYRGSPVSKGILQPDMWDVKTTNDRHDWDALRSRIATYGVRNSLLLAPMPTASTSQILGNTEACEVLTSNIYTRRVLAGEFIVVNSFLIDDLIKLKLWGPVMKDRLIRNNGSVQNIEGIPDDIKALYKTAWEVKQKVVIDMAADRGAFIDQSQSMNIYMAEPTRAKLNAMHFHGWRRGLKTGSYYLRTRPAVDAIKFTVASEEDIGKALKKVHDEKAAAAASSSSSSPASSDELHQIEKIRGDPVTPVMGGCTIGADGPCTSCSS